MPSLSSPAAPTAPKAPAAPAAPTAPKLNTAAPNQAAVPQQQPVAKPVLPVSPSVAGSPVPSQSTGAPSSPRTYGTFPWPKLSTPAPVAPAANVAPTPPSGIKMIGNNTANWEMAKLNAPAALRQAPSGPAYVLQPEHILGGDEQLFRRAVGETPLTPEDLQALRQQHQTDYTRHYAQAEGADDNARQLAAARQLAQERLTTYDDAKRVWAQNPSVANEATVLPPNRLPAVPGYASQHGIDVYDPDFERWWAMEGPIGSKGGFQTDNPYARVKRYAATQKAENNQVNLQEGTGLLENLLHTTPSDVRGDAINTDYARATNEQQGMDPLRALENARMQTEQRALANSNQSGQQASNSYFGNLDLRSVPGHAMTVAKHAPGVAFSAAASPLTAAYGAATGNWNPAQMTAKGVLAPFTEAAGVELGDPNQMALHTGIEQAGTRLRHDAAKSDNALYRHLGRFGGAGLEWAPTIAGSALLGGIQPGALVGNTAKGLQAGAATSGAALKQLLTNPRQALSALPQAASRAVGAVKQLPAAASSASSSAAQQLANAAKYTGVGHKALWNNMAAAGSPEAANGLYQLGVKWPAIGLAATPVQTLANDAGLGKYQQQAITALERAAQDSNTNPLLRILAAPAAGALENPLMAGAAVQMGLPMAVAGQLGGGAQDMAQLQVQQQDYVRQLLEQKLQRPVSDQHVQEELRHMLANARFDVDLNRPAADQLAAVEADPRTQAQPATPQTAPAGEISSMLGGGLSSNELTMLLESAPLRQQLMQADPQTQQTFLRAADNLARQQGQTTLSDGLRQAKNALWWTNKSDYAYNQIRQTIQQKMNTTANLSNAEIDALIKLVN